MDFFKIYLTNPALRTALFSPLHASDPHIGNVVETAIFGQWFHRYWMEIYYARWRSGEVDIVGLSRKNLKPVWAVEVKWSDKFFNTPEKLKSLKKFLTTNKLDRAVVTTISKGGTKEIDGVTYEFIPAAVYAYNLVSRTIE